MYGLNPWCILMWVFNVEDLLNALPHVLHLCGFSLVCMILCRHKVEACRKPLPQTLQMNGRAPDNWKIIIKAQFYERWLTLLYWYLLHMPQHWLKSLMLSSPRSQKTNLTRFELWHGIKPRGQELRCTTMIAWLYNIKRVRKEFLLFKLKVKVPCISPTDLIWTYFKHLTLNSSARPGGA